MDNLENKKNSNKRKKQNIGKKKKKVRRRLKKPVLVILILAIAMGAFFVYRSQFCPSESEKSCYVNKMKRKSFREVSRDFNEDYLISDYAICGESLCLYHDPYGEKKKDDVIGKNVELYNVETKEKFAYTFSGGIDGNVPLGLLPQGLYEVYVYDHYEKKRVYFNESLHSQPFVSMRRNNQVKKISLEADQDLLKKYNIHYDKNYLFLTVEDTNPEENIIDIVIDPGGNVYNPLSGDTEIGAVSKWMEEPKEAYEFSKLVQKKLQDVGLRVRLSRAQDEVNSYYGENGRTGRGYQQRAKVFLSLGMVEDENLVYPFIRTSPYTNASLANEVAYTLSNANIELSYLGYHDSLQKGVVFDDMFVNDKGKKQKQELYPALRESGGKSTYAGTLDFAKENKKYKSAYGMDSIMFYFANVGKVESVEYYKKNKEKMADQLVKAIVDYYQIGGTDGETTIK